MEHRGERWTNPPDGSFKDQVNLVTRYADARVGHLENALTVCPRWSYNVDRRASDPALVNLIALFSRFSRTCRSREWISDNIVRHVRRHFRLELQAFCWALIATVEVASLTHSRSEKVAGLNWPARPKTRTPRLWP